MPSNGKIPSLTGTPSKPLCFVIGPIGKDGSPERKHSDLLLNAVVKQVLQHPNIGYIVKRADEDADPGMIGDRVVSDIINAELVVADLTDLNPNAFYELGIRHSTERPTIHIARTGTVLPFDTIAHRTIFVDLTDWHSIESARERLASSFQATQAPDYKVSNPITQANASFRMRLSEDPRDRALAEIQERLGFLERQAITDTQLPAFEGDREMGTLETLVRAAKELRKQGVSVAEVRRQVSAMSKKLLPNPAKVAIDKDGDREMISIETKSQGIVDYL